MRAFAFIFLLLLLVALPARLAAQVVDSVGVDTLNERPVKKFMKKAKKKMKEQVRDLDRADSLYIEPNHYDWTLMVQNTNFYQVFALIGRTDDGTRQTIEFAQKPSYKVGPYIGWRWIFLGYTFDLSRLSHAANRTEASLSIYSKRLGGDIVFIKNSGDFTIRRTTGFDGVERKQFKGTSFSGMSTYTMSINAYYVFNHHHFSYPAAYNQSTVQKRSAGSGILGFRYDHQRLNFDHTQLPSTLIDQLCDELQFSHISYRNYSICGGYAYNWVFARNWLFAVSLTPAIGIKKMSGEKLSGAEIANHFKNFNVDFVARAGLVWNTQKYFAGISLVSHLYDYRRDQLSIANSVNYLNTYVGFYFGDKKKIKARRHRRRNASK